MQILRNNRSDQGTFYILSSLQTAYLFPSSACDQSLFKKYTNKKSWYFEESFSLIPLFFFQKSFSKEGLLWPKECWSLYLCYSGQMKENNSEIFVIFIWQNIKNNDNIYSYNARTIVIPGQVVYAIFTNDSMIQDNLGYVC